MLLKDVDLNEYVCDCDCDLEFGLNKLWFLIL